MKQIKLEVPNYAFHWAPKSRRKSIIRTGLMPGSWSRDRLWKPPHICVAESPRVAWILSGRFHEREEDLGPWDLWEVWLGEQKQLELIPYDDHPNMIKEIRIFERVYKRNVWLIGSRSKEILK